MTSEVVSPLGGLESSIAETGYRLCAFVPVDDIQVSQTRHKRQTGPADEWRQSFSACWDPTDNDQLYVCSQNGLFKVINIANGSEKIFQVLFRRYEASLAVSGASATEAKPLYSHWDKMVAFPGRPGELAFLLGVSNKVSFSAVPGSPSPLAALSDASCGGFVYGCSILEIYSHTSRVTSMASSPFGHLLASGDEQGHINFVNLTTDSVAKNDQRTPAEWWACPSATPGHSNPLVRAHSGPLFALQWLPIFHRINAETTEHYLATGSEDRMVKLWKITCSKHRSVELTPLMVLDTLSTHVLCLNSVRYPKEGMRSLSCA